MLRFVVTNTKKSLEVKIDLPGSFWRESFPGLFWRESFPGFKQGGDIMHSVHINVFSPLDKDFKIFLPNFM